MKDIKRDCYSSLFNLSSLSSTSHLNQYLSSITCTNTTSHTSTIMTVKVGAVQAEPVWLDLEGGVEKVISLIKQAGADGVNVLGFPEVFIPGYPW